MQAVCRCCACFAKSSPDQGLDSTVPVEFDRTQLSRFMDLDQGGKVKAEYVYLEASYMDPRHQAFEFKSKSMTLDESPETLADLPMWSYSNSESEDIMMIPRFFCRDPFRKGVNILVLADSFNRPAVGEKTPHGEPMEYNTRPACVDAMDKAVDMGEDPWFGLEQEYYLLDAHTNRPLGWPETGGPGNLEAFHGATGATKAPGREIVEAHYQACLYCGLKIGGVNAEDAPGQWEYQIGPCPGVEAADQLWMSRFVLQRICEIFKCNVTFDPKPQPDYPGLGGHTNYSTQSTRTAPGGWEVMKSHFAKLEKRHPRHMKVYGPGNERRLTGEWDTAGMNTFRWGVDDRDASIRITSTCVNRDAGYYEDRRPAASMDPYQVTRMLVETTLLCENGAGATSEVMKISGETLPGQPDDSVSRLT